MKDLKKEASSIRLLERRIPVHGQRGQSLVILTFAMVALLVFAGLALDVGTVYGRRVQLARATDAAAMAAVIEPSSASATTLNGRAYEFVAANGFPRAVVTATRVTSPTLSPGRLVRVEAAAAVDTLFMRLVGWRTVPIREDSLAEFQSPLEIVVNQPTAISTTLVYGIVQDWNLFVVGPDGPTDWGDAYLPLQLGSGAPNPYHNHLNGAYPFRIYVPADYPSDELWVEILDPDSYNYGAGCTSQYRYNATTGDPECMDEYNDTQYPQTEYTLLYLDTSGHRREIGTRTYRLYPAGDLRYVIAFRVTLSDYPDMATTDDGDRNLYLQVGTTGGRWGNGFHLWAGPPHDLPDAVGARNAALRANPSRENTGGVLIYAQGYLPNILYPGHTPMDIALAYIPPEAAGHTVRVHVFDCDVEYSSPPSRLEFYLEGTPDFSPPSGQVSNNDAWATTVFQIPGPDTFFGAYLYARYTDNTHWPEQPITWRLEYDDLVTQLATVRLVQ